MANTPFEPVDSEAETPHRRVGNVRREMGLGDKIKNKAEELVGQGKEKVGEHTDNEDLRAEGKGDQSKAGLKQTGEDVKDAFK